MSINHTIPRLTAAYMCLGLCFRPHTTHLITYIRERAFVWSSGMEKVPSKKENCAADGAVGGVAIRSLSGISFLIEGNSRYLRWCVAPRVATKNQTIKFFPRLYFNFFSSGCTKVIYARPSPRAALACSHPGRGRLATTRWRSSVWFA